MRESVVGRHFAKARHEFRFGTRELVFLALAFLLVWGLTFVLGVLVGRELSDSGSNAPRAQATARSDEPGKAEPKAAPGDRLTFYHTLTAPTVELPTTKHGVVEERIVAKERSPSGRVATGAAPAAEAGPEASRRWTVQVSSFRSRTLAEELRRQLIAKGYDTYLVAVDSQDGRVRYRVRVGSFATRGEAEEVAARLRAERNLNPFVTPRTR